MAGRWARSCPIPISEYPEVSLAYGGGGSLTNQLIEKMFFAAWGNPELTNAHDGALLQLDGRQLAFTTDSFVVSPLFFPGGDIGTLAVNGTVNDLAMCGARPQYLSMGFIIEEGLPMETLWDVVMSIKEAAETASVSIVTGDTKVVERGKGDGLFINSAGIGSVRPEVEICPSHIRTGDRILLSGDIGRHGTAILSVRESLAFETELQSDCEPVSGCVIELIDAGIPIHCLRDLTRGGLATAVIELSKASGCSIRLEESRIQTIAPVNAACEILGLDPLYVANEGRFAAFVPENSADAALDIMRKYHAEASEIGRVMDSEGQGVVLQSVLGTNRYLDLLSGEQLPRIC